ncbi:MAG: hypothetical protein LIR50_11600, partial [Bacillota bacterium]|nr:hypothetical protein [Bacillota bacterium]
MDKSLTSKLKVVIVNGMPESGKTTFEHMCEDIIGSEMCLIYSTIDPIKQIATTIGWDGTKTPRNRKFLSDLKDLLTEFNDYSLHSVENQIEKFENGIKLFDIQGFPHVAFVDCREPGEIEKLKKALNAVTLLIRRPNVNMEFSNHADANV